VTQAAEDLPGKLEALSSNPSTSKKNPKQNLESIIVINGRKSKGKSLHTALRSP
jgi:hypothetical protein